MNNEEWEDYKELSGEITEKLDNTATYESWLIIQEYVDRCQEKNKKYKEVIEKAINFINNNGEKQYNHNDNYRGKWYSPDELNTLEDILKEVE